jgi:hypothetical protein
LIEKRLPFSSYRTSSRLRCPVLAIWLAALLRRLCDLVFQVTRFMIAAELTQRRFVELKQNLAECLGFRMPGGETLSVNLAQRADHRVSVFVADFTVVVAVAIVETRFAHGALQCTCSLRASACLDQMAILRRNTSRRLFQPQHPFSDPPAISLRFAEPPSVEGTGGGQIGEGGLGAVAVVLAAWVDVSGSSPGNNRGDCDIPEAELVAAVAPCADPVVVADPDAVSDCDAGEGDDTDGNEDAGTLRGSDPTALALLLV